MKTPVLALALLASGCGDSAPPPKPVALGSPKATQSTEAPAPAGTEETLPPGHPPAPGPRGPASLPAGHPPMGEAADSGESVAGTVVADPKLGTKPASTDVLYLIARAAGAKEILAVRREEHVTLPFSFRLSGKDAMSHGTAFKGPFDVTARLSKSGDAAPAKGDLEGMARGVQSGAKDLRIVLDSVRR